MARSEDYGQGRGRTRRPYDDQDLADRRAPLPAERSDTPTQGRRAGTSYAPQFDRYVAQPAPEPVRPSSQATPRTGRADPRQAPAGYAAYPAEPQTQGWDDQGYALDQSEQAWAQAARPAFGTRQQAVPSHQQTYDPRGQVPAYGYEQAQSNQGWNSGYEQGQDPPNYGYADPNAAYAPQHAEAGGYQGYDPQAGQDQHTYDPAYAGHYAQGQPGYAQQQPGYGQYPQDYHQGYADQDYQGDDQILANGEYAETDPSMVPPAPARGRRGLIVAGAFVAAVLIGGGLGFVYKMTSESSFASSGEPPLLTASDDPVKTVVEEAGVDDSASKSIYDRLNGDGDVASATALGDGSESVDVARTDEANVIETDPIVPGVSFPDEAAADGSDQAAIADGVGAGDVPEGALDAASAEGEAAPKIRKVQVVNVTPGELIDPSLGDAADGGLSAGSDETATTPAPENADPALDGAALVTKPKAKKKPKTAAEQVAALADAGGEVSAPKAEKTAAAGAGFVVQAAVANTRLEALSAFADMQQRYGSLLAASQPDIQPIDGNKGYRLRIGPPASKQAAKSLCDKLKSSGWKDCFIRSY